MTIIVQDAFTVGADTNLDGRTPSPTGTLWSVIATDAATSVARVFEATDATGASVNENGVYILASCTPDPSGAEYDVQLTVTTSTALTGTRSWGLFARYTDTTEAGYALYLANGAVVNDRRIVKRVGGVVTVLAQTDVGDFAVNDVVKFEVRNAAKKLFVNGAEVLSTTDDTVTAAGRCGIHWGDLYGAGNILAAWRFDDYIVNEAGAPTAAGYLTPMRGIWG